MSPAQIRSRRGWAPGLAIALGLAFVLGLQVWSPAAAAPVRPAAAMAPTAIDDSATVSLGTKAHLAGASNDTAGSATVVPGLTVFPTGQGSPVSADGRTLEVAGHGTFELSKADGSVTFTAWSHRTGTVTARYQVTDANGATDEGLLSVIVTAGGDIDDVTTYQYVSSKPFDLLANDTPGRNADGTAGTLDRTSVRFAAEQYTEGVTVSSDGRMLTDPGMGVLTIDSKGLLTFASEGPRSSDVLWYTAQDTTLAADRSTAHHAYLARIFLTAYPNQVLPGADYYKTPYGASVTGAGIKNDHDSNPAYKLLPGLSRFWVDTLGPGDYLSPDGRKYRQNLRGTLTINPDGTVLAVPAYGFKGVFGATMFVYDDQGNRGQESVHITVEPGPHANADSATTKPGVPVTVPVLDNDVPGLNADAKPLPDHDKPGTMDKTFVRFATDGQPEGVTISNYDRTLTVRGQGVFTADRVTGAITFVPEPGFTGTTAPVAYAARDSVTRRDGVSIVHNTSISIVYVTVEP